MKQKVYIDSYCEKEDCREIFRQMCIMDSDNEQAQNENEAIRSVFLCADAASKCLHRKVDQSYEPKSPFRVVGYDSFSHEEYTIKTTGSLFEANRIASEKGGTMNIVYVYDDNGKQLEKFGTY